MMGEYVKYKGKEVKMGTCENLYYVTYPKLKEAFEKGLLRPSEFSVHPEQCLKPDSGFLFRFPFPDEDKLGLGEIGAHPYNRRVPIRMVPGNDKELMHFAEALKGESFTLNLVQQKFVHRESDGVSIMAAVFRELDTRVTFRIEGEEAIKKVVGQIVRNHLLGSTDEREKRLYLEVANRILVGYGVNPALFLKQQMEVKNKDLRTEKEAKRNRKIDSGLQL